MTFWRKGVYVEVTVRTAIVTTSYPRTPGDPAGHFVRSEARELRDDGHRVTVLCPGPTAARDDGIDVVCMGQGEGFGFPGVVARVRESPTRILDVGDWIWRVRQWLLRNPKVVRVAAHWALPSALCVPSQRFQLVMVSHGADVRLLRATPAPLRNAIVNRMAAECDAWRFVSSPLRESLLAALRPETRQRVFAKSYIQAPALEVQDVKGPSASLRAELGKEQVALSVGRLISSKRVDRAIATAEREGFDRMIVIGDGPMRSELEHLAKRSVIPVQFLGALPRPETLAWIAAADKLIFASEEEGLSTVLREAEALGTQVLCVT